MKSLVVAWSAQLRALLGVKEPGSAAMACGLRPPPWRPGLVGPDLRAGIEPACGGRMALAMATRCVQRSLPCVDAVDGPSGQKPHLLQRLREQRGVEESS